MSLSAWIRRVVDREIAAREGKCPTCGHETALARTAPPEETTTDG
jgi:hypothetical protein